MIFMDIMMSLFGIGILGFLVYQLWKGFRGALRWQKIPNCDVVIGWKPREDKVRNTVKSGLVFRLIWEIFTDVMFGESSGGLWWRMILFLIICLALPPMSPLMNMLVVVGIGTMIFYRE